MNNRWRTLVRVARPLAHSYVADIGIANFVLIGTGLEGYWAQADVIQRGSNACTQLHLLDEMLTRNIPKAKQASNCTLISVRQQVYSLNATYLQDYLKSWWEWVMYNEINMETYLNNLEYWIGYIKEHGGLTLCE